MFYLVKNGVVVSQSENEDDVRLVWEPGCEIMTQFPPVGKVWDAQSKTWKNTPELQAELDAKNLETSKLEKIAAVNSLCAAKIVSGFSSEALEEGEPYHYQSETIDQLNLQGVHSLVQSWPAESTDTVDFRCVKISTNEDAFVPHTREQIEKVFSDGKVKLMSLLKRAKVMKEEIKSLTSISAVENYNIENGW